MCSGEEGRGVQLWTARSDQGSGASLYGRQQDHQGSVRTPLRELLSPQPPAASTPTLLTSLCACVPLSEFVHFQKNISFQLGQIKFRL